MHRPYLISILLLFLCAGLAAQENNMWYFGTKAALNFNPSTTGPIPTVLSNSVMDAKEGSANICDKQGNLLFYTNGLTIYNKNHQVMLNGDGLMGNISSVQSSIIIPQPGSDSLFFVFTSDAIENNYVNGYRYSIVDITRDGGKGEVITKNVLLWSSCTERMVAARHADGISVWLITNDNASNTFRSWLVTCTGIQPAPVVSTAGIVLNQNIYQNTGMMKVSPDGKQLCQTIFPAAEETSLIPNFCQLFDFNNLSGTISNAKMINFPGTQIIACDFSPDSKLLYLTCPANKAIDQVEPKLPTAINIIGSKIRIPTPTAAYYGIQIAPDGKLYLAQPSAYLGAINLPNVKGTGCNFVQNQLQLSPGSSFIGFPSFINDLSSDPNNGFFYAVIDSCTGLVQFNGISTMAGSLNYEWDFGDGNTSTLQNPQHAYSIASQTYTVRIKITSPTSCGYIERSKTIFPGGIVASPDFEFIAKCDSGYVRFTNLSSVYPDASLASVLWDFGDGNTSTELNPIHPYSSGGVFNVKLSLLTTTPCLDRSIIKPINLEILDVQAFPNITVDAGQTVQLGVTGGGSNFLWTPATGLSDPAIANPVLLPPKDGWYKVTVTNDAGCKDTDSVYIKVNPYPGIYVPSGFTPNNDGKNDVFRPTITKEYTLEEFSIYNRWGQRIFTTSEKGKGWNGKLGGLEQVSNVFIWILNATDTRNGQKHRLKGTFVLLH